MFLEPNSDRKGITGTNGKRIGGGLRFCLLRRMRYMEKGKDNGVLLEQEMKKIRIVNKAIQEE